MTDIPGTIITAIREAIQQAVLAERARFSAELAQIEECMRVANEALLQAKAEQDAAVLAERERCAKIAKTYYCSDSYRMSGDAVAINARVYIAAKIRNEPADPEPAGQFFDIQAGTFVSNKADDRAGWAKRFANMAARTIEEDRNAMQQRYADPSAQASDIDRNKRG